MVTPDQVQAARLALLEAAMLSLLSEAQLTGDDELSATASTIDGVSMIEIVYSRGGKPTHGESL